MRWLKEQKVSSGEIVRGTVSLKQWHMKPLCSLSDEQRLPLLLKLKEQKISLKEVKEEANKLIYHFPKFKKPLQNFSS